MGFDTGFFAFCMAHSFANEGGGRLRRAEVKRTSVYVSGQY
jgi:hypothetical protein